MALLTRQRIISNGLGQLRFEELWPAYHNVMPDASLIEGLFAPKLPELRRLIEDLVVEQRRKVVVFSQWRRMLRLAEWSLRDILTRTGARAAFFTGAERPRQRTQSLVDFHDDPDVPILFLSDAGGVGLNLQRAANACINLELPWNPAVLEQRIGRIYRLGQEDPIDVFHLVSEYGIESRIANVLGAKQALFSGLFDGTSDQVQFASAASFLSSVQKLVEIDDMPAAPAALEGEEEAEDDLAATEGFGGESGAEAALADEVPAPASEPEIASRHPDGTNGRPERRERTPAVPAPITSPAALLESLTMDRMPDGRLRIEAPPGAAEQLVELFAGMARLLEGAAGLER
jgi:superfamily II DNA/RNA helicase